jgi:hypothetical protein
MLRAANIIFWLALTLWIAGLVSSGIAAYAVFGELPTMSMQLQRFEAAAPAEQGMIAAGHVMQKVFRVTDIVQYLAASLATLTMVIDLVLLGERRRWMSNALRIMCITIAGGVLLFRAMDLTPRMDRELRAYWAAAEEGRVEDAKSHRAAFTALHPRARMLMTASLVMLLAAAGASAVALGPHKPERARREAGESDADRIAR